VAHGHLRWTIQRSPAAVRGSAAAGAKLRGTASVCGSAGLSVPEAIPPVAIHPTLRATFERLHPELTQSVPGRLRLGIAPFASTRAKTYDPALMQEALRLI